MCAVCGVRCAVCGAQVELEVLMRDWDVEGRGYLTFDSFVSIIAHVMKEEELDEQIER